MSSPRKIILVGAICCALTACTQQKPVITNISFSTGGAFSEAFEGSSIFRVLGQQICRDRIRKLSPKEQEYLRTLPRFRGDQLAFANNVIISFSDGENEFEKLVVWSEEERELETIARKLAGEELKHTP